MDAPSPRRLARFSRTERAVHWVYAAAFVVLLGSGLCLYLPSLAEAVGRRPLLKTIHVYTALALIAALVVVVVVGDRRSLRATAHEVDVWDRGRPRLVQAPPHALGTAQRRPEAQLGRHRLVRRPVHRHRRPPLVRRARHALPLRRHDPRPRLADVHLAVPVHRPPLPLRHPPEDTSLARRHHPRLGRRGLGARAPPHVGGGSDRGEANGRPVTAGQTLTPFPQGPLSVLPAVSDVRRRAS